jgi:hypothetical protein
MKSEGSRLHVAKERCCCLKEGGEKGTNIPHGLHITIDAIAPDGCHKIGAALVEFSGIPRLSLCKAAEYNYQLLVPLLAGRGPCPPSYGNNDESINQSNMANAQIGIDKLTPSLSP